MFANSFWFHRNLSLSWICTSSKSWTPHIWCLSMGYRHWRSILYSQVRIRDLSLSRSGSLATQAWLYRQISQSTPYLDSNHLQLICFEYPRPWKPIKVKFAFISICPKIAPNAYPPTSETNHIKAASKSKSCFLYACHKSCPCHTVWCKWVSSQNCQRWSPFHGCRNQI